MSGNGTVVIAITCHFEIAAFAPGRSPTVLNDVVVSVFIRAIADSQNAMVRFCRTFGLIVSSTLMMLQAVFYTR